MQCITCMIARVILLDPETDTNNYYNIATSKQNKTMELVYSSAWYSTTCFTG